MIRKELIFGIILLFVGAIVLLVTISGLIYNTVDLEANIVDTSHFIRSSYNPWIRSSSVF